MPRNVASLSSAAVKNAAIGSCSPTMAPVRKSPEAFLVSSSEPKRLSRSGTRPGPMFGARLKETQYCRSSLSIGLCRAFPVTRALVWDAILEHAGRDVTCRNHSHRRSSCSVSLSSMFLHKYVVRNRKWQSHYVGTAIGKWGQMSLLYRDS